MVGDVGHDPGCGCPAHGGGDIGAVSDDITLRAGLRRVGVIFPALEKQLLAALSNPTAGLAPDPKRPATVDWWAGFVRLFITHPPRDISWRNIALRELVLAAVDAPVAKDKMSPDAGREAVAWARALK